MKTLILITAAALCISSAPAQTIASRTLSERKENIKEEKAQRQEITALAKSNDFQAYVKGAEEEIAGNEKRFVALRVKIMADKKEGSKKSLRATKKLEKNLEILEKYNDELKADLATYLKYGEGDWKLFKKEFNGDLTELSQAFKELRYDYVDFVAENGR